MKIILACLLISSSAFADDWTKNDSWREATYLTLHTLDWAQTRNIARNPDKWREQNSILGKHPSVGRVDGYFALAAIAHVGIAYALPKDWRIGFTYVSIGVELGWVHHNHSIGVSARF